jgi:uncharacterized protein (TIGR02246 family)
MNRRSRKISVVLAFCGCFALLLMGSACSRQMPADTRAADEATIRDLDAQWSKAASANDLEAAVSFYSDDASLLPPNAPILTGKQAIHAAWAELVKPGVSVSWQPTKVEVARSGDFAYLTGVYRVSEKDAKGNPVEDHGKLVEIWKKQADGKWKTITDIYNSDLPPAMLAEKTAEKM